MRHQALQRFWSIQLPCTEVQDTDQGLESSALWQISKHQVFLRYLALQIRPGYKYHLHQRAALRHLQLIHKHLIEPSGCLPLSGAQILRPEVLQSQKDKHLEDLCTFQPEQLSLHASVRELLLELMTICSSQFRRPLDPVP